MASDNISSPSHINNSFSSGSSLILTTLILRYLCWPLLACLGVALVTLLLERLLRLVDMVLTKAGPLHIVVQMLGNLIPHYLGIAIPIAFFIAIIFTVIKLSQSSEWDAAQSLGFGLAKLLKPLLVVAAGLTLLTFFITGYLQPHTRYAYRALVHLINETAWNATLERGSFFFGLPNTVISIDGTRKVYDDLGVGQEITGIFIQQTPPNGNETTIAAEKAQIIRANSDDQLVIILENGLRLEKRQNGQSSIASFQEFRLPIDFSALDKQFRDRGVEGGERELTFVELIKLSKNPPALLSKDKILAEIHGQLVRNLSILALPFWAIALGIVPRRRQAGLGIAAGLIVIITYHQMIQLGHSLVGNGEISPVIALWLPFICFSAIGYFLFHLTATRPGFNAVEWLSAHTPFLNRYKSFNRGKS